MTQAAIAYASQAGQFHMMIELYLATHRVSLSLPPADKFDCFHFITLRPITALFDIATPFDFFITPAALRHWLQLELTPSMLFSRVITELPLSFTDY